jgi:hypothetical protein
MNIAEIRKAVVAFIGIALIILKQAYGWSLPGIEGPLAELVMSAIMGAATVYGVWRARNKPKAAS